MTIRDLQRIVEQEESKLIGSNSTATAAMQDLLNKLRDRPFYRWNKYKRDQSFNDIIGLPTKHGRPLPLFDYQYMIYKVLIIPNYVNSRPATDLTLCHSMEEKRLKERERNNTFHSFKLKHLWIKKATGL